MPLPVKDLDTTNPSVTVKNDAKLFVPADPADLIDPVTLKWQTADSDQDGAPARDALLLGLHLTASQLATIIPISAGFMTCRPLVDGQGNVIEHRLYMRLANGEFKSTNDLDWLQTTDVADGVPFDVDAAIAAATCKVGAAQVILGVAPDLWAGVVTAMTAHLNAGNLEAFRPGASDDKNADHPKGNDVPRQGTGDAVPPVPITDPQTHLQSWLDGESEILFRFPSTVQLNDADLITLQPGDAVTLYAEVGFRQPNVDDLIWYRLNMGFFLPRLRASNESPAPYTYLADGVLGRIASGITAIAHEQAQRADLVAVAGGSLGSLVLLPSGLVPPQLFSFITSDQIAVFGSRLVDTVALDMVRSQPTLARADLEGFWQRHKRDGFTAEPFKAGALSEFEATDYDANVGVPPGRWERTAKWYATLPEIVHHEPDFELGILGTATDSVQRTDPDQNDPDPNDPNQNPRPPRELIRKFVPGGRNNRPDHPGFVGNRKMQLRRLYPLVYFLRLGSDDTAPLFSISQDTIDCIRQEYAFHMNWKQIKGAYYYQPTFADPIKYRWHPLLASDTDTIHVDANGVPQLPAMHSSAGTFTIPQRSDLRRLEARELDRANIVPGSLSVYSPYTLTKAEAMDRLADVRDLVLVNLQKINNVLTAKTPPTRDLASGALVPNFGLSDFLQRLMEIILDLRKQALTGPTPPDTKTTMGFLQALLFPQTPDPQDPAVDAIGRFNDAFQKLGAQPDAAKTIWVSSSWRPPEHNETIGNLINSNHQIGLALDLQPSNTGPGKRNPLFIAALHDVNQRAFARQWLSEALLENSTDSFLFAQFDVTWLDTIVVESVDVKGKVVYGWLPPNGTIPTDLPSFYYAKMSGIKQPSQFAAEAFRSQFDQLNGLIPSGSVSDWPRPSVLELYAFTLCQASHVHFTFEENQSLQGL